MSKRDAPFWAYVVLIAQPVFMFFAMIGWMGPDLEAAADEIGKVLAVLLALICLVWLIAVIVK